MGNLYIGQDTDGARNAGALLKNSGDVVLVPGVLECFGTFDNTAGGNLYVCPVTEAVIPVNPAPETPLVNTKRVVFGAPMKSYLNINDGGSLQNAGTIRAAEVQIVDNGRTGALTPADSAVDAASSDAADAAPFAAVSDPSAAAVLIRKPRRRFPADR